MNGAIRTGVIGVGVMGQRHAEAIQQLPYLTLAAIADVDAAKAKELGTVLSVPSYTDYSEMLNREDLHAVTVATPDQNHREPTCAALERGLAVLLEKPVASTMPDARAIAEAAGASGARVMVGHTLRYDPGYLRIAHARQVGQLGRCLHLYARRNATTRSRERIGGRTSISVFQGVHDFDVVRWITGAEVTRVYGAAVCDPDSTRDVADAVVAILQLTNGGIALVEQSWSLPSGIPFLLDARLEVVGTRGAAYLDATTQGLSLLQDGEFRQPDIVYGGPEHHILKDMYTRFVACLRDEAEPVATLEDGIEALRIALAVDESARLGEPVELGR